MDRLEGQGFVLAPRQDGVRQVPLDLLQLCWQLQVLGEGGEPLAAAGQPEGLLLQTRGDNVHMGQTRLVGLGRHGHGVV